MELFKMAILADLTARTHSLVPVINSLNLLNLITDSITPTAHTSVGLLTFTLGLTITSRLHAKRQSSNDQWGRSELVREIVRSPFPSARL
jgi:hypothetical protein